MFFSSSSSTLLSTSDLAATAGSAGFSRGDPSMSSRMSRSLPAISFTDGASLAFLPRPTTPLNTPRTPLHWVLYAVDRSTSSVCSVSAIFAALSARSDSSLATSALSASASAAGTTSAASARASAAFARSTALDAMA